MGGGTHLIWCCLQTSRNAPRSGLHIPPWYVGSSGCSCFGEPDTRAGCDSSSWNPALGSNGGWGVPWGASCSQLPCWACGEEGESGAGRLLAMRLHPAPRLGLDWQVCVFHLLIPLLTHQFQKFLSLSRASPECSVPALDDPWGLSGPAAIGKVRGQLLGVCRGSGRAWGQGNQGCLGKTSAGLAVLLVPMDGGAVGDLWVAWSPVVQGDSW